MDGNSIDTILTPEFEGQGDEATLEAPDEPTEDGEGQSNEDPADDGSEDGQGNQQSEGFVPVSQYKELQKAFTKKSMENAQLRRTATTQQPQQQTQVTQQPFIPPNLPVGTNPLDIIVQNKVSEMVGEMIAPIQQQQQNLQIQATVNQLAENDEFEDVAPAFVEVLENNPEFLDMENGLEMAYKVAKADYLGKLGIAKSKAAAGASQQVKYQKASVTESAQSARQQAAPGSDDAEAKAIKESMMALGKRASIF